MALGLIIPACASHSASDGALTGTDGNGADTASATGTDPNTTGNDGGADAVDGGGTEPDWEDYLDDPTARPPFRNGAWYKDDPEKLDAQVNGMMAEHNIQERRQAAAIVTPHAGIIASGKALSAVYARVKVPDTVIILAPNHSSQGEDTAIWNDGPFVVPGHGLHIRHDIVERFVELLGPEVTVDREAWLHKNAHPTEMQLPFLSTIHPKVKLVPISIYNHNNHFFQDFDVERIELWGKVVAQVLQELSDAGEDVLLVATTDLSHYVPKAQAKKDDSAMLDYIAAFDVDGLYDAVIEDEWTICGEIPVAIMMSAMTELGYTSGETIIQWDSSHMWGEDSKDSVVGYPGVVVWK